jgi:hypothetical protein
MSLSQAGERTGAGKTVNLNPAIALTKTQRHKEEQIIEAVGPIIAQVTSSTDTPL